MARFRKVDPRIWNDGKFREMSEQGKLAFLFILTHPHMTAIGAMRGTIVGMAAELGMDPKGFREPFTKGLAEADETACYIGLPRFVKYNPPENPNVVKHWVSAAELVPECDLKTQQLQRLKGFTEGLGEGFGKAFAEGFGEGFGKPVAVAVTEAVTGDSPSSIVEEEAGVGGTSAAAELLRSDPLFCQAGDPDVIAANLRACWPQLDTALTIRRAINAAKTKPPKTNLERYLSHYFGIAETDRVKASMPPPTPDQPAPDPAEARAERERKFAEEQSWLEEDRAR